MDINADIGKNVTELLGKLAEQIGTTTDKVFPWYIKQQILEGWIEISVLISVFFLGLIMIILPWKKADFERGNNFATITIIGTVLACCSFFVIVFSSQYCITQILNPNFHAIKSLTSDMAKLIGK